MANAEDECTGRFWEGRFKSQALLDVTAVLQCMAYVDLNPVRAGMASTLNESDFTSIQERLAGATHNTLLPFSSLTTDRSQLPFAEAGYFELLEWGVSTARAGKNRVVENIPAVFEKLHIDSQKMADFLLQSPTTLPRALGSAQAMRCLARSVGLKFIHGVSGLYSILRDKNVPVRSRPA
ncbi:hypothetical protein [Elongatibacter sediminis]|uniref:Transposase n=1 Tax=Elongatibacter sediminis TaxID=3119006 RepID=A0AAW9RBD7_9GAMM